ncbi:hypothetical protein GCM10010191_43700 [Actinomadura vinacea]|uniref:Tetratricopeptide repeat protein n=1 Tax=Actinomadura vinacea TaxID=115336 RepID=A0ABN3JBK4_9ACTN
MTTGDLLKKYAWEAEDRKSGDLEGSFTEIRARYEEALRDGPDKATAATGLAVLTAAKLLAYVRNDLGERWWDHEEPPLPLNDDQVTARSLAEDVVQAARRALELDPSDNLAAFTLGLTLEHLGDRDGAVEALLTALRLDPADHVVEEWLPQLGHRPPERPATPVPCRHSHAFFLLRHAQMVNNSGDRAEWSWPLDDAADVRRIVDGWIGEFPWDVVFEQEEDDDPDYWDPESPDFDPTPDHDLSVEIHIPGEPTAVRDVNQGLRRTPDDEVDMDWQVVPLPQSLPNPLPPGRPIRTGGVTYFSGENQRDL